MNERDMQAIAKAVAEILRKHLDTLPDPEQVRAMVAEAVAELPPAEPGAPGPAGKDADPEQVRALVAEAVAELPPAEPGAPGPAGKDADPEQVRTMVAEAVAELPPAEPGPEGPAGKDADPEQVRALVAEAVAELPKPQDGRDGLDIEVLPAIESERSYPRGKYARHVGGLWRSHENTDGMRGWECVVDGIASVEIKMDDEDGRTIAIEVTRSSGATERREFQVPSMIYRKVYREGEKYAEGDTVTWGGSLWVCLKETKHKPGSPEGRNDWQLAVKKGRDGRNGKDGGERKPEVYRT